jgi:hypothetical protein
VIQIGRIQDTTNPLASHHRTLDLLPGDYYAQVVYDYRLVMPFSRAGKTLAEDEVISRIPERAKGYDAEIQARGPLLISEPVKFTVASPADAKVPLQTQRTAPDGPPVAAEIKVLTPKVIVGRQAQLELRFVNVSGKTIDVSAPILSGRDRASSLAIIAEDGTLIGDLFATPANSLEAGWIALPPGGLLSRKFEFNAGFVWDTQYWNTDNLLPPGKYFLEWRIHHPLISGRPWDLLSGTKRQIANERMRAGVLPGDLDMLAKDFQSRLSPLSRDQWRSTLPGPIICRSNRVELEILPRTGD